MSFISTSNLLTVLCFLLYCPILSYASEKSEEIIKTFIEVFSLITLTVRII